MHPNQHSYESGKSCESVLYALINKIENTLLLLLQWNLMANDLAYDSNKQNMYAQGYADDFVILIKGKHLDTC